MLDCIVVGIGGFAGSVCRYLIGLIPVTGKSGFPVKTFLINIIGSFLIGLIAAAAAKNGSLNPRIILFLKVGICVWRRSGCRRHVNAGLNPTIVLVYPSFELDSVDAYGYNRVIKKRKSIARPPAAA